MRKDKGVTAPRASLCSPPSSLSLSPAVPSGSCIPPETRPPRFSTMLSGSSGFPYSWDTALSPAESGKTTCSPTQGDWLPPAFLLSIPLGPLLHHPVHDPAVSIPAILPLSFPPLGYLPRALWELMFTRDFDVCFKGLLFITGSNIIWGPY